jgi:hypothetical protein
VTDGAFTTCPDGSQEWSDVPVTAFPDSHSFLYADQANLNPSLSSSNNTFVLLYDECGRTVPLGPNEYVLVNFKTVEVENGAEKLNIYTVHLFTDGTIIFFENGFLKPPGRAKIIEGMQGAVGFGPSPNCASNHVIAEFQIELSAAGGHSYSPDPIFWSSVTPSATPSPQPPPATGPTIAKISVVRNRLPIEMGDPYLLDVRVVGPFGGGSGSSVTAQVTETNDLNSIAAQPQFGDHVRGTDTQNFTVLPLGVPNDVFFPVGPPKSYSHTWNWLGNESGGFWPCCRRHCLARRSESNSEEKYQQQYMISSRPRWLSFSGED